MTLPAIAPTIGPYTTNGTTLTASAALASYSIDGEAEVPSSGGLADCTPAEVTSQVYAIASGGPFTIAVTNALAFTACQ